MGYMTTLPNEAAPASQAALDSHHGSHVWVHRESAELRLHRHRHRTILF